MLNKIINSSVRQKAIVGLFILALIGYGSYELTRLPIDAVPDITNNQVQVITSAPALGATDIERLVTFPVEQANSNIPGLIELRSFSRFGLSVVTIVFDDETDVYWARQQVQERLQNVKDQIPPGVGAPTLGPITTGLGEIYQYIIKPKKGYENRYDQTELRTIQDWYVRRDLLQVKGVADVSSFGGKLKQFEIAVDPNKLNAMGLTLDDVFNAVEMNNQNAGGSYIEHHSNLLFIRTEGLLQSITDLENIAIKNSEQGTPIYLKEIGKIQVGHATRFGGLSYDGIGEAAGAIVMMVKGGNSSDVIKNVKEKITEIEKTLPQGVEIVPFLDRTKMVNNSIHTVQTNLMEGALIVIFILVLFLGNLRAGLIVASVIPLAMLFAIIMMNLFGVSGNLMSLGALDFGLIVDGAVIIVEAVMHIMTHSKRLTISHYNQLEMDSMVKDSAGKMMNSAVFGQIIILIVYLPIFSLQGIEGKMFKPMAQTVAFALVGAFILSLTYIPMMTALVLSKKIKHEKNFSDRMLEKVESVYALWLNKILYKPKMVLVSVISLFVISVGVLTTMGGEFIPVLEEGDFAVETRLLTGSSLKASIDMCLKAEKLLKDKFLEVKMVVGKTGSGEIPTDPMPVEATDLMIILKDKKEWTSAETFDELAEKMGNELEAIPGVTFGFQYPVQMRFNELMTGARQDVVCKVYGEDLNQLANYADQIGKVVNTIEGATDLFIEPISGMPQIVIQYDRNALSQFGLTVEEVNRMVNIAFSGKSAGTMYEGEKRFDLVVRLENEQRKNVDDVNNLLIPTNDGHQIPLYIVAKVEVTDGPNQIQRENTKRRIVVGFNVRGRDVQSMVEELKQKVDKNIPFEAGYNIEYGGSFKNLDEAKSRLAIAVPVALFLIFILLYFAFNSIRQGLLIYTAIPLSAIGGIFALAIRGLPFSISAGVGFIALFGVAVLNGIVLIAEFNRLQKEGMNDLYEIVKKGTRLRMRPVLMTALVASLGFLPMAVSNGAGAEVQRPLATVVIGGLLLATFLTLFVLPILYILFNKKMTIPKMSKVGLSIILCSFSLSGFSQEKISLQTAIDSALANNLKVRNSNLINEYQKSLIGTAYQLAPTNVQFNYGQINSFYRDNQVGVSQNFDFPTVYKNQKNVFQSEWDASNFALKMTQNEIQKEVEIHYFTWIYLANKKDVLLSSDSIFSNFMIKSELRFRVGETNILEKTAVENQQVQIQNQIQEIEIELQRELVMLKLLLNTTKSIIPDKSNLKYKLSSSENSIDNHPYLKMLEQTAKTNDAIVKLEKSKLLPAINFGVNSGTMYGVGSNEQFYDYRSRFNNVQFGIAVPLSFRSQKNKINTFKIQSEIAKNNLALEKSNFENQLEILMFQFKQRTSNMNRIESKALANNKIILDAAQKQFQNGEISYLEWTLLVNQTFQMQTEYLNAVHNYNMTSIELSNLLKN